MVDCMCRAIAQTAETFSNRYSVGKKYRFAVWYAQQELLPTEILGNPSVQAKVVDYMMG